MSHKSYSESYGEPRVITDSRSRSKSPTSVNHSSSFNSNADFIKHLGTYEYTISCLLKDYKTEDIICVADGIESLRFKSLETIPKNLALEHVVNHHDVGTTEYHWRSKDKDDSLYVFFDHVVHKYLIEREEEELRSKPIIISKTQNNDIRVLYK